MVEFGFRAHLTGPNETRITLAGELDFASRIVFLQRFADVLETGPYEGITVDLSGLTFIDSAGLHALIDLARRARTDGWRLTLCDPSPVVERIMEVAGVHDRLPFAPEVAAPAPELGAG